MTSSLHVTPCNLPDRSNARLQTDTERVPDDFDSGHVAIVSGPDRSIDRRLFQGHFKEDTKLLTFIFVI